MRKQNGITLIALVISIIVMLILAGVSINAIVGENGVLSRAQYSSFLNEMAAVEEAVQLWKAGELIESKGQVNTAIPANGLCNVNELTATERLVGEIGYYRTWSIGNAMPDISILTSADDFNKKYEGEFVFYPAGVQDLYYLNNEALGLDEGKVYLIDASTSMVYSMSGIKLNGVRCYSLNMAKAITSGVNTAPMFSEAEVSGTGAGGALAGNVQEEFLPDGTKNPDYNPYGFQIIADSNNKNIYKLYNNGELYGKGIKGLLLDSSDEEMEAIDISKWHEFIVPLEIPGYNTNDIEIIPGHEIMFIIDSNKELWAWGNNANNRLGLSYEQQIDYTGRDIIKLNIDGKTISRVFPLQKSTFVLTTTNELYACGYNTNGELGIGNRETSQNRFYKVDFQNPQNILTITNSSRDNFYTLILTNENKVFFAGSTGSCKGIFNGTNLETTNITKFIEIFNETYGTYPESEIVNIYSYFDTDIFIFELANKKLYRFAGNFSEIQFENESANVNALYMKNRRGILLRTSNAGEKELWGYQSLGENIFGVDFLQGEWCKINELFPNELNIEKIKDIYISSSNIFYLLEDGSVFASGTNLGTGNGLNSGYLETITRIDNLPKIEKFVCTKLNMNSTRGCFMLQDISGKKYVTGQEEIIFRDDILQKSWKLIASNVKKFNASTASSSLAYIDKNNDIWVLGKDATLLGVNIREGEEISHFIKLKDYLEEQEIYNNIDGKVEDYAFADGPAFYIKTNADDNNTLYVCGKKETNSWYKYTYLGIEDDAYIPTKVKENVKIFNINMLNRFIFTYDNELYTWGKNDGNSLGNSSSLIPILNSPNIISHENISKIYAFGYQSYIITNQFENRNLLWVTGCGIGHSTACNGLGNTVTSWTAFDMNLFNNENIKKIVTADYQSNYIVLTENGNLYGWGPSSKLGIGSTSNELNRIAIEISTINNKELKINNIMGGSGFFIFTTEDGKVYGTGSNKYGILGRWIGIDRNSPNSRYKTAFDWVECPELEI